MRAPRIYRRLASARKVGFATGGWISLYVAADHLLLRASSGFVETYRRFYFVDIEAITVRTTVRGVFWNVALGVGLCLSLGVMPMRPGPHVVSGFFAALFTLLLILNIALGKTCATQLQTRVQKRELPIRRLRKALRVVDQLSGKIETAQAEFALATPAQTQPAAPAPVTPASTSSVPPPLPREKPISGRGWVHAIVFAFLMLSGVIEIWAGLQHTAWLRYSACAALFLNLLVGIAGLLLQRRFRLWRRPSIVVWISFIAHAVALPTIYFVYSMIYSFQMLKPPAPGAPSSPLSMQMPLSALGNLPGFDMVLLISGAISAALALAGYFAMLLSPWRINLDRTE